jgi:2-keto-3-deoxy-6-phosphogluconate aldolase
MKEIGTSVAQLFAMIMILITLAVSTAAVSQWFSADVAAQGTGAAVQTQPLLASGAN